MDISNVLLYGGIAVVVLFLIILFCVSYIKAAPDEIIIISGFRKRRTINSRFRSWNEPTSSA